MTIRYIVHKTNTSPLNKSVYFSSSYGGAESMYDNLGVAKRQASRTGDKIYKLDLSSLGTGCPVIGYELVFTRGEKEASLTPEPESSRERYGIGPDGEYFTKDASANRRPW